MPEANSYEISDIHHNHPRWERNRTKIDLICNTAPLVSRGDGPRFAATMTDEAAIDLNSRLLITIEKHPFAPFGERFDDTPDEQRQDALLATWRSWRQKMARYNPETRRVELKFQTGKGELELGDSWEGDPVFINTVDGGHSFDVLSTERPKLTLRSLEDFHVNPKGVLEWDASKRTFKLTMTPLINWDIYDDKQGDDTVCVDPRPVIRAPGPEHSTRLFDTLQSTALRYLANPEAYREVCLYGRIDELRKRLSIAGREHLTGEKFTARDVQDIQVCHSRDARSRTFDIPRPLTTFKDQTVADDALRWIDSQYRADSARGEDIRRRNFLTTSIQPWVDQHPPKLSAQSWSDTLSYMARLLDESQKAHEGIIRVQGLKTSSTKAKGEWLEPSDSASNPPSSISFDIISHYQEDGKTKQHRSTTTVPIIQPTSDGTV